MRIIPVALLILTFHSTSLLANTDCISEASRLKEIQSNLESGQTRAAIDLAADAVRASPDCIEPYLILAEALNQRLDEVSGLSALGTARRYKRTIRQALEIEPDNLDARTEEIGFLIHAPGIVGGSQSEARERIDSLTTLSPVTGAQMEIDYQRVFGDGDDIIDALTELSRLAPDDFVHRSELARRLILAGRTEEADIEVSTWPVKNAPEWVNAEQLYLRAAARVYGNFEFSEAELMLREFIQLRPSLHHSRLSTLAQAHALLGQSLEQQNDFEGAEAAYSFALEQEPQNERALSGLQRISANEGNTQ